MKKNMNMFLLVFALAAFVINVSCKKDDQLNEENNQLTDEILKVETSYKEGDIKIETKWDGNSTELVTEASFEYKDKIRKVAELDYSKTHVNLKGAGNLVGIFKDGTCGSYSELVVYIDNEDSSNGTNSFGTLGSSFTNRNTTLKFCVVPNNFKRTTTKNFAVLNLTGPNPPAGVSMFTRYTDDEDTGNTNKAIYNNSPISGHLFDDSPTNVGGNNTTLSFFHYRKSLSGVNLFPNYGMTYLVLGTFNVANKGEIFMDDENNGNANWCYESLYNDQTGTYTKRYNSYYIDGDTDLNSTMDMSTLLMMVARDTRFYLSKAIN